MDKIFQKNDSGFICVNCEKKVAPLGYTSRDHCPYCLTSLHVDINPGDRANDCKGQLKPIDVKADSKKGHIIVYKCEKCGQLHNNKSANDDDLNIIISVMNHTYSQTQKKGKY